jgi:uncharacterized protein (DUF302 family)
MASANNAGIIHCLGRHSVEETVETIKRLLEEKGIKLFALIDHSGEAEKVGMSMPQTKLLIFGDPKSGTPLMLASPGIALDLPLKILVRQSKDGTTWISFNSPAWLGERHNLPEDLVKNIAGVEILAQQAGK